MSRLEELIQELCPNGVEYKPLSDKTLFAFRYGKGNKIPEDTGGQYDVYGANGIVSHIDEYNCEDVTIIGHIGAVGLINRVKGKCFVTYNGTIATVVDKEKVDSQYLYYVLTTLDLPSRKKGSQPFLSVSDFDKIAIPVPPLEVQREIVRILDSFTLLTAELTAELTARKKQYEYYRNHLLTYDASVKVQTLGEVCNISAGGDAPKEVMTKEMTEKFSIPIISNGIGENALYGYTNIAKINTPAVTIAARGTIGYAEYRDYPYFPIIRLLSAIPKDTSVVDTKYLYYCLKGKQYSVPMGGIPQLTAPKLKNVKIPVPNIEEQQSIVDILDRFDSLCNDITTGLPAEIEARQKQYEFYRDKLLSFKQL